MKGFLVSVFDSKSFNMNNSLEIDDEMRLLSESAGIEIINPERFIVKYRNINPKTFFTKGKIEQINNYLQQIDQQNLKEDELVIVFNIDFSPTQIRNCEQIFERKIITKTQLIYQIFLERASSKPAKIQLELANLKYMKSRLAGSYENFDRIRGGIGLKGPGETKLEVDRRTISKKIKQLEEELEKIEKHLLLQAKNREDKFIFSLVGYTNAGKTSLLNLLTKANQYSDNALFTTVNVKSRQLFLENGRKIIVSDTIGFIRQLPIHLVESFKTTLLEIKYSSLIGIVVDSTSSFYKEHIEIVEDMLNILKCENINKIIIFNKIDLLSENQLENFKLANDFLFKNRDKEVFYISTKTKQGINLLLNYLNSISKL
ncbi:MAG: GTPase HflX [Spirochaetales bacterium]|nr:GTPase HflX [Exilispira sp.]NMC67656.1 GTPase HflX [Spirochaetales bacterium]